MAKKPLTVEDATKEELLHFMFVPDAFGGGYRIPIPKDSFILWLENKRRGELYKSSEVATEAYLKYMHESTDYMKKSLEAQDFEEKMRYIDMAEEAHKKSEAAWKQKEKLEGRLFDNE